MRQAGRYLPGYRERRAKAESFWSLCFDPVQAAEITLEPIRRFDFDGAIVFSDILVIPVALGVTVTLEEGVGPRMRPVKSAAELGKSKRWDETLSPTYETLKRVRKELPAKTTLIGFAGGPWTLATYLAEGRGSEDRRAAKLWAYRDPQGFAALLDRLADAVAEHLRGQLRAGADVVQIFESWSQGLPAPMFERWIIAPTRKLVGNIRTEFPKAKIIGFPRATTLEGYERYARETGVDAVSIDTAAPAGWARRSLAPLVAVQGNLDPMVLVAGGKALDESCDGILGAMKGARFIFNLGHGILPETPIGHVEQLIARIRGNA
jgi:uroporphyrinogen decarboxylase